MAQPGSSALPRTLLGARARASFVANLREAVDDPDDDIDPILTSRHVGPEARRRYEEETRERLDEDSREPRRSERRTRSSLSQAGISSHNGKESNTGAHGHPFTKYAKSSHYMVLGEGGSPHHNASGSRLTPPIASSSSSSPSRGHSNYSPLPSTQSHPHLYTHPPPPPPPHFQNQHYSNPRQHSHTPEPDNHPQVSPSPGSGIDVEMGDDPASGMLDHSPPSNPHPIHGATQDHDPNGRDHRNNETNGNANPNAHDGSTIGTNFPLRSENPGIPVSVSRNPDSGGPSSAPRRESTRIRRSKRTEDAATRHVDDEPGQPGPARRTRASKRGGPSASPAIKTRVTRRGGAAAAAIATAAEAQASARAVEARELTLQHSSSTLTRALSPASREPTSLPSSLDTPITLLSQEPQTHNASPVDEGTVAPIESVPFAPSHPSYLDPALASQSTSQLTAPVSEGTAAPSNFAGTKSSEAPTIHPSPMDNIIKVAEAAVAAQNAANAALKQTTPGSASPPVQPTVQITAISQNGTTNSTPTTAATPSSATSDPYMVTGTAAAVKPTINTMDQGVPSPTMPVTHPMALGMNPYAMYYPPGMPMSPNAPTYPYANPYYYMAPMHGPSGIYPANANFVPPGAQRPPSDVQRHAKPKRLKAHTVTSKNFSIPMVPRDKSGKPMLPLNVGIMTVIKLGDVCMREHFHTERYIFPVGYEVSRHESLGFFFWHSS